MIFIGYKRVIPAHTCVAYGNQDIREKAMFDNEMDTNTAYKRVVAHPDLPNDAENVFVKAYQDEKKCKLWLETTIDTAVQH